LDWDSATQTLGHQVLDHRVAPVTTLESRAQHREMVAGVLKLTVQEFDDAIGDALDNVPAELLDLMNNVVFLVEDEPPPGEPDLLGVYDGTPLTERHASWAAGALPDRITIFRGPTLRMCSTRQEVLDEVAITVVHEIAHHFGIDDARLRELGWD
jgi:predicted Zn-dependent protease with MMP-like domain